MTQQQYNNDLASGDYFKTHKSIEAVLISNEYTEEEAIKILIRRGFQPFITEKTDKYYRFYQYQPREEPYIKKYEIDVTDKIKYIKVLFRL